MSGEPIYTWLPVMMKMMKMMWFSLSAAMCASHTLRHTHSSPARTDWSLLLFHIFVFIVFLLIFILKAARAAQKRAPSDDRHMSTAPQNLHVRRKRH